VLVGDAFDERNDELQARRQGPVVAPEALDDPGVLLRNDLEGLKDEDGGDDRDDDRDFHVMPCVCQALAAGVRMSQLPSTALTMCSPPRASAPGARRAVHSVPAMADARRPLVGPAIDVDAVTDVEVDVAIGRGGLVAALARARQMPGGGGTAATSAATVNCAVTSTPTCAAHRRCGQAERNH
jgi:hypothetical protein